MRTQIIYNLFMFGKSKLCKKIKSQNGFWEYVTTVAIILVIIAFIVVPDLKTFATGIFTSLNTWWGGVSSRVFSNSAS